MIFSINSSLECFSVINNKPASVFGSPQAENFEVLHCILSKINAILPAAGDFFGTLVNRCGVGVGGCPQKKRYLSLFSRKKGI